MQIAELIRKLQQYEELEAKLARLKDWANSMPDIATLEAAAAAATEASQTVETVTRFNGLSRLEAVVEALNGSGLSTIVDLAEFLREGGYPIDKKAVSNALYRAEKADKARRVGTTADGRTMWGATGRGTAGGDG